MQMRGVFDEIGGGTSTSGVVNAITECWSEG